VGIEAGDEAGAADCANARNDTSADEATPSAARRSDETGMNRINRFMADMGIEERMADRASVEDECSGLTAGSARLLTAQLQRNFSVPLRVTRRVDPRKKRQKIRAGK
jgi:hypothetical protein